MIKDMLTCDAVTFVNIPSYAHKYYRYFLCSNSSGLARLATAPVLSTHTGGFCRDLRKEGDQIAVNLSLQDGEKHPPATHFKASDIF